MVSDDWKNNIKAENSFAIAEGDELVDDWMTDVNEMVLNDPKLSLMNNLRSQSFGMLGNR